jgi:hypothetical protein
MHQAGVLEEGDLSLTTLRCLDSSGLGDEAMRAVLVDFWNLASTTQHATAGTALHATTGSALHATAGTAQHATAGTALHAIAGTALHAIAGTALHTTAGTAQHAAAGTAGTVGPSAPQQAQLQR